MWYNGGMTIDNWINLIAAIIVGGGTLFLGIMAWRTIKQTRSIQKAEKRERLLNEIIEWASGCIRCAFELDKQHVRGVGKEVYVMMLADDLIDRLRTFYKRKGYIKNIATPLFFGEGLSSAVKVAIECLEITIQRIETDTFGNDEERNEAKERLSRFTNKEGGGLSFCMNKVLEEAANIKTKNIGKKEQNMSKEGEATGGNEPTLKDIEEHLKQQDKQMARGTYFSGYIFGATLIFIAFGLLAGKYVLTTELSLVTYSIVMLIGGTVLMGFAWYKRR